MCFLSKERIGELSRHSLNFLALMQKLLMSFRSVLSFSLNCFYFAGLWANVHSRSAKKGYLSKPGRHQYSGIETYSQLKSAETETVVFTEETTCKTTTFPAACDGDEDDEIDCLVQFVPGFSSRPGFKT